MPNNNVPISTSQEPVKNKMAQKVKSVGKLRRRRRGSKQRSREPREVFSSGEDEDGASKKALYKRYDPRRLRRGLNEGIPPAGYCYIWVGNFKRWQRRFMVMHTPGIIIYFKRANRKGPHQTINLKGANVVATDSHQRQLVIVAGSSLVYIRALHREYRAAWLDCIQQSIRKIEDAMASVQSHHKTSDEVGHLHNRELHGSGTNLAGQAGTSDQDIFKEQAKEALFESIVEKRLDEAMQKLNLDQVGFLQHLQGIQQGMMALSQSLFLPGMSSSSSSRPPPPPPVAVPLEAESPGPLSSSKGTQGRDSERSSSNTSRPTSPEEGQREGAGAGAGVGGGAVGGGKRNRNRSTSDNESHSYSAARFRDDSKSLEVTGRSAKSLEMKPVPGARNIRSSMGPQHGGPPVSSSMPESSSLDHFMAEEGKREDNNSRKVSLNSVSEVEQQPQGSGREMQGSEQQDPVSSGSLLQGPLAQAWQRMIQTTRECLRKEIERAVELEMENDALQESFEAYALSQGLVKSRPKSQMDLVAAMNGEAVLQALSDDGGLSEASSSLSITPLHSRVGSTLARSSPSMMRHEGDEEFFEALEVLNHHEFHMNNSENFSNIGIEDEEGSSSSSSDTEGEDDREDLMDDQQDLMDDQEDEEDEEGDDFEDLEDLEDLDPTGGPLHTRTRLPSPAPLSTGFNLWTLLKNAIGRDLNSITLPASINEPLSALQRATEEMEHLWLLERALQEPTSLGRLLYLAVFACTPYAAAQQRTHKPFNPILGETFEWMKENSYRLAVEQVSHHPPICAWHAESLPSNPGPAYTFYGEAEFRNKFWGKTADLIPVGSLHLDVPELKEHYSWNKVRVSLNNLIMGRIWINIHGEFTIRNHNTGEYAKMKIVKASTAETVGGVEGAVYNANNQKIYKISGNHLTGIFAEMTSKAESQGLGPPVPASQPIFKPPALPHDAHKMYNMSQFAIELNELTPFVKRFAPPTDSRFRPDQRALEDGNVVLATSEKLRLEELQRSARKQRKEDGEVYKPVFFTQSDETALIHPYQESDDFDSSWKFNHLYWSCREKKDWAVCPKLYN